MRRGHTRPIAGDGSCVKPAHCESCIADILAWIRSQTYTRHAPAQDQNPQSPRLVWAAKPVPPTLYKPPNRLIWRLSEILAKHRRQAKLAAAGRQDKRLRSRLGLEACGRAAGPAELHVSFRRTVRRRTGMTSIGRRGEIDIGIGTPSAGRATGLPRCCHLLRGSQVGFRKFYLLFRARNLALVPLL